MFKHKHKTNHQITDFRSAIEMNYLFFAYTRVSSLQRRAFLIAIDRNVSVDFLSA